jgi:zinc transport system substrate-binding protein
MSLGVAMSRLALAGAAIVSTAAGGERAPAGPPPVRVAVSVGPLVEVVERIGGPEVRVTLLTPPATPPESWTPTPREALALTRAELYVSVGHPLLIAETQHLEAIARGVAGLARLSMAQARPEATGSTSGRLDPHVWMDIDAMAALAERVATRLMASRPEGRSAIEDRLASYLAELARVDQGLAALLAPPHRRPAVFQHPAWRRLLDRYGVESVAIEVEGKEASPAQLARLIEDAGHLGVRTVFTQVGISDRGARLLAAEIGAELVALDPTSSRWLETLRNAGERFAAAVR